MKRQTVIAHGFGHAAQAAPVVNRLRAEHPGIDLLVVTDIARPWLETWFHGPFDLFPLATDPGIRMQGPLPVDVAATVAAYLAFDRETDTLTARPRQLMDEHRVRLVLADVPWLPLQAAADRGLPAIALCSLNRADILEALAPRERALADALSRVRAAYRPARGCLQPAAAMPMPWLPRGRRIGRIARTGRADRRALRAHLGVAPGQHLAVLQLGGEAGTAAFDVPQRDDLLRLVAGRNGVPAGCVAAGAVLERLG